MENVIKRTESFKWNSNYNGIAITINSSDLLRMFKSF